MAASEPADRDTWMSDKPSVDPCLAANALALLRREMFGEEAAPVRLGRYEIESRIGAGGMGTVYEALDPALGRRVAIKLLRRESTAEEGAEAGRARLRREAMALAMLSHPNVVTIHDVGEADGGGRLRRAVEGAEDVIPEHHVAAVVGVADDAGRVVQAVELDGAEQVGEEAGRRGDVGVL